MIIVSQDRKKIFNFDNISIIHIMDNNKIWVDTEKTCNNLGTYATEERAKEVLLLLTENYKSYKEAEAEANYCGDDYMLENTVVYEMPKE